KENIISHNKISSVAMFETLEKILMSEILQCLIFFRFSFILNDDARLQFFDCYFKWDDKSVNYPLLKVNYLPTDIAWILVPFKSLICFLNSAGTLYIDLSVHADILLDWKVAYLKLDFKKPDLLQCLYNIL
ncbi:hypothetical protein ACJX0J_027546, partial [Zea mays]